MVPATQVATGEATKAATQPTRDGIAADRRAGGAIHAVHRDGDHSVGQGSAGRMVSSGTQAPADASQFVVIRLVAVNPSRVISRMARLLPAKHRHTFAIAFAKRKRRYCEIDVNV